MVFHEGCQLALRGYDLPAGLFREVMGWGWGEWGFGFRGAEFRGCFVFGFVLQGVNSGL